jgi:Zn-dependent protease with chaperone function
MSAQFAQLRSDVAIDRSSIKPLLHPTEPSRLALALVVSGLALAVPVIILLQIPGGVLEILFALAFIVGSIWLATQMRRARLLGQSVRVDSGTFPELQAMVEGVCDTLQYHRTLEVYVIESSRPSILTTSLLGTRIILIEGGLVAELMEPSKRSQLTFLLGRSVGALRAKHTRLDLVVLIMQAADVLKYVTPFILPYYRATAYSGDQIGMMCCSDLEAALEATRRLLVGGAMASELTSGAVLPQSMLVKRRLLPRLVQLLASEPHVTNRYANLLCFARYHDPELWTQQRASMTERELQCLDGIWRRSPYRWRVNAAGELI